VQAYALMAAGALDEARTAIGRGQELALAQRDEEGLAIADQQLGNLLFRAGDLDAAAEHLVRARDAMRRMRGTLDAGWVLVELAQVQLAQGRAAESLEPAGQAVADFRKRGDSRGVAGAFVCAGRAWAELGNHERARALLDAAARLSERSDYPAQREEAVKALAGLPASI
jgi:tetratricopeptide (TPR) repeat protein